MPSTGHYSLTRAFPLLLRSVFAPPPGSPLPGSLVRVQGTTFENNTAASDGAALCVTTGVSLAVSNSSFLRNEAKGAGAAIVFDGAEQSLDIRGSRFLGNRAGGGCGAVSVKTAAAITVADSDFEDNQALTGGGGALCYAQPPAVASQVPCIAGQVLDQATVAGFPPVGDLVVVAPGVLVPQVVLLNCTWTLRPPPGCRTELRVTTLAQSLPNAYAFSVTDAATGQPATPPFVGGLSPEVVLPPPILSSGDGGLVVSFVANNANIGQYATGFAGSFRSACPAAVSSDSPPSPPAPPPRSTAITTTTGPANSSSTSGEEQQRLAFNDFTRIVLSGGAWRNNTAPKGDGGAVFVSLSQGLAGTRRAQLTVVGGVFERNAAGGAGGGGALLAANEVALSMDGAVLRGNVASAGAGGGLRVVNSASAQLTVVVFEGNLAATAGGGASFSEAATEARPAGQGAYSLSRCNFTGNAVTAAGAATAAAVSAAAGGAISVESAASLAAAQLRCSNNTCAGRGGCLALLGVAAATVAGGNISSNSALAGGGGLLAQQVGNLTVTGAALRGNAAGGLSSSADTAEAADGGGALLVGPGAAAFAACDFSGNAATGDGGAAFAVGAGLVARFAGSAVEGSRADGSGGGLAASAGAALEVANTTVTGCSAGGASAAAAVSATQGDATGDGGSSEAAGTSGSSASSAAAAATCSAAAASRSSFGGGVWAAQGGSAALTSGTTITRCASSGGGGGVAVGGGGSALTLSGGSALLGNRATGGGAAAVVGDGKLALLRATNISGNQAYLGAVVGFFGGAGARAAAGGVTLSGVAVADNAADAGGLFAAADDPAAFAEPPCDDCSVALLPPASYGVRLATPPASIRVVATTEGGGGGGGAPTGGLVASGVAFRVSALLSDAFGQGIPAYDGLLLQLSCAAWRSAAAAAPAPCRPGSLSGQLTAAFT